jgi:hypothetical protein
MENKEIEELKSQITNSKVQTTIGILSIENSRLLATVEVQEAIIKTQESEIAKLKEAYELEISRKSNCAEGSAEQDVPQTV